MEFFHVGGILGGECFLILTDKVAIMLDTGFAFCAGKTISNIKKHLNGRNLDYILLSHSHYDHVSGTPYLKKEWENVQVIASDYVKNIFARDSAIKLIRELNDNVAQINEKSDYVDMINDLKVDIAVKEGDILTLGDVEFTVWETPGHTKCSISYYCEKDKLLLASETIGICTGGELVAPAYLVDYDGVIRFIRRIAESNVERIFAPHFGVLSKEESKLFVGNAMYWNSVSKDKILYWHKQGLSKDEIAQEYSKIYYNEYLKRIQPKRAYDINTAHTINVILRDFDDK